LDAVQMAFVGLLWEYIFPMGGVTVGIQ